MEIRKVAVKNFKSLVNFTLPLAKFSCLVGLNGSGKSTVLQFIDFAARQFKGDIQGWLNERQWMAADINSRLTKQNNIDILVELIKNDGEEISWMASFNRHSLRCTSEKIISGDDKVLFRLDDGHYSLSGSDRKKINFDYQGSLLSQLKESVLTKELKSLKDFFVRLESNDLLSPELLRQKTKASYGTLGLGGRRLSSFIAEMGEDQKKKILDKLKIPYHRLFKIHIKSLQSGLKQLEISEEFDGHFLRTSSRQINDGLLRIMAILAQLAGEHSFLLFDEIENGINAEIVEFLIDSLVNAEKQQVMVTTHSPMILNYLDNETASKGVFYLYKTAEGFTKAIPFFNIPSVKKKLLFMGPGEAFVDTNLVALYDEICNLPGN